MRRAREFIELRYQEEISLGKIAGLVNVSATYFSELFSKAAGMTFVEYVARVRVEKAKNVLKNPNKRNGVRSKVFSRCRSGDRSQSWRVRLAQ